jgi:hypothetical protein
MIEVDEWAWRMSKTGTSSELYGTLLFGATWVEVAVPSAEVAKALDNTGSRDPVAVLKGVLEDRVWNASEEELDRMLETGRLGC